MTDREMVESILRSALEDCYQRNLKPNTDYAQRIKLVDDLKKLADTKAKWLDIPDRDTLKDARELASDIIGLAKTMRASEPDPRSGEGDSFDNR